jgi:formylglycine-generating enzyme required for sulfatase activity
MQLVWNRLGLVAAALVMPIAIAAFVPGNASNPTASRVPLPDLVRVRPGSFSYRASGEFTRDGKPARAPAWNVAFTQTLAVMRQQVTEAEYWRCAEAGACPMVDQQAVAADRPMVKVSWHDAQAYAAWLSRQTGVHFRLPTDEEWAYAAGSRFVDDALPEAAYGDDPGRRMLAVFDGGVRRTQGIEKAPQPVGTFGANEHALLDLAGSVWEWTDSCYVRAAIEASGDVRTTTVNCGVRVVEGAHRTYITDFIRDALKGGCAVGTPPSNLGFRLVRDDR